MANVHGENLHHPDTEAIKGRCIRTNFLHYILKCIKCPEKIKYVLKKYREHKEYQYFHCLKAIKVLHLY